MGYKYRSLSFQVEVVAYHASLFLKTDRVADFAIKYAQTPSAFAQIKVNGTTKRPALSFVKRGFSTNDLVSYNLPPVLFYRFVQSVKIATAKSPSTVHTASKDLEALLDVSNDDRDTVRRRAEFVDLLNDPEANGIGGPEQLMLLYTQAVV